MCLVISSHLSLEITRRRNVMKKPRNLQKTEETEEPMCNIYSYSNIVNEIK